MNPTCTTRSLIRVILGMLAVSWLLSAGRGVAVAPCEAAEAARVPLHRPSLCDQVTHLDLDFLNDQINPIQAFNVNAAELPGDRTPRFHVYALTDDPRYYANVTFEKRATQLRLRTPIGSEDFPGNWEYSATNNNPVWAWTPTGRPTEEDRIAFIDVMYHCQSPRVLFQTRFMLTVRGTGREAPAPTSGSDLTAGWDGVQLVADRTGTVPRYRLEGSLRLRNQGEADAGPTRVVVFLSQDRQPGADDQLAGFVDLPALGVGAETPVEVDLSVRALPWSTRRNVIAVIDSSGYASETNEANNLAVFGPLP